MRVKELEHIEDLMNIKDDEVIKFHLDYEISDCYKRIEDEQGNFNHIEHLYWIIKIFNQKLLDEINTNLNLRFVLNEEIKTTKDIALDIWHYVDGRKDLCGTFGDNCLNPKKYWE